MNDTPTRFSLRDLPTPAKLVITCFLLAVGLGYFSAMVQLHLQHSSRNGEPLPSVNDVVEIFSGWRKATDNDRKEPKSKLQTLIVGPIEGLPWSGTGSMAPAFFHRSKEGDLGEKYSRQIKDDPKRKESLDAERNGERAALDEWLKLPAEKRKAAFDADAFPMPPALKGKPITPDALTEDKSAIKVKLILTERCFYCHSKAGEVPAFPLDTDEHIAKYATIPPTVEIVDGMVGSQRQIGIEKLTQSTHAHLLSFAMLFSLTGFVFAFTSYRSFVRCAIAPLVVVAQVCDVSCWWLARIDGVGPLFAQAIIVTGTITAIGLLIQIFGSLWNMWTGFRRVLLVLVLLLGGIAFGVLATKVLIPALEAEKQPVKP